MRVELNENGCLSITGQTPTESYALAQWRDNWVHKADVELRVGGVGDTFTAEIVGPPDDPVLDGSHDHGMSLEDVVGCSHRWAQISYDNKERLIQKLALLRRDARIVADIRAGVKDYNKGHVSLSQFVSTIKGLLLRDVS